VRRNGQLSRLDAEELVPGDVVVLEAGDRVPADGRLLSASSLEVQESSLTGEAQPVAKSPSAEVQADAPLGTG
jgi:Ca2+-transporting ATPase